MRAFIPITLPRNSSVGVFFFFFAVALQARRLGRCESSYPKLCRGTSPRPVVFVGRQRERDRAQRDRNRQKTG